MKSYAPNAWSEIIAKAAVSPLGIAALVSLIVGLVVLLLFHPDKDRSEVRLGAVALLMFFCGGLMFGAIYSSKPVAPSQKVAQGAANNEPSASQVPSSSNTASPAQPAVVPAVPDSTAPMPSSITAPAAVARADCGAYWTGWIEVGNAVGSPCPEGCSRGDELGQSYRVVGLPPRLQTQHKFQCWRE